MWKYSYSGEKTLAASVDTNINTKKEPLKPLVSIIYPDLMYKSSTTSINMQLEWTELSLIAPIIKTQLISPVFEISPASIDNIKTSNPTTKSWLVSPKKEGDHMVRLVITYSYKEEIDGYKNKFLLKDNVVNHDFDIFVPTVLGISIRSWEITKIVGALLSVLILFPYFPIVVRKFREFFDI